MCERAASTLEELSSTHDFNLEVKEITSDKKLFDRYFLTIPVVNIDGEERFDANDIELPDDIATKLTKLVLDLEKS